MARAAVKEQRDWHQLSGGRRWPWGLAAWVGNRAPPHPSYVPGASSRASADWCANGDGQACASFMPTLDHVTQGGSSLGRMPGTE